MEKTIYLKRVGKMRNCTIGELHYMGRLVMHTIERPWLNNEKNISCVPVGEYELSRFNSVKHPDCYAIENRALGVSVNGDTQRTACLFHVANFVEDVQGCIGPGMSLHPSRWGVMDSMEAMRELRKIVGSAEGWKLVID